MPDTGELKMLASQSVSLRIAGVMAMILLASGAGRTETGEPSWTRLPDLPTGISGQFAGTSGRALLVAGGTYFPVSLFEGGKKLWVDTVQLLAPGAASWTVAGRLPQPGPTAYGISAQHGGGLVIAGGCDAERHYATVSRLRWAGGHLKIDRLPDLPEPAAYLAGARLGSTLYAAGGQETPASPLALKRFRSLDLSRPQAGWRELEAWPGPARILPIVAVVGGDVFLASGAELFPGPDGKPARRYLKDAYRYRPGEGWQRIADLPRPGVAAPHLGDRGRLLVFGGDDGANAARIQELKDRHPGFSREILAYAPRTDRWTVAGAYPAGLVTTNAVRWRGGLVIPGGEDRPGHRVPVTLRYR